MTFFRFMLIPFLLVLIISDSLSIPIDNGVVGYPDVVCGPHSIRVDTTTAKPFNGRIFVKGESDTPGCSTPTDYAEAPLSPGYGPKDVGGGYGPAGSLVTFELGLGQCNMRRQRTLYPRGVEYTFTMVVSFHPLFITKIDRAYRVRCFYMEAEKTVHQSLDVSMLTTAGLEQQFPMPQCTYHITTKSYDGPPVKYAKVGEPVTHIWSCDQDGASYVYGMLVKNCYVDDGHGKKFQLVDALGCPIDRHLMSEISYDEKHLKAYVETHVFKFADKPSLYFWCTVELCVKADGGCNGITPPHCGYGPPVVPPAPVASYGPPPVAGAPYPVGSAPLGGPPHPGPPLPPQALAAGPPLPYAGQLPPFNDEPVQKDQPQGSAPGKSENGSRPIPRPLQKSPETEPLPTTTESPTETPLIFFGELFPPPPIFDQNEETNQDEKLQKPPNSSGERRSESDLRAPLKRSIHPNLPTGNQPSGSNSSTSAFVESVKQQLEVLEKKKLVFDALETDVSSPPLVVLPFEEPDSDSAEVDDEILDLQINDEPINSRNSRAYAPEPVLADPGYCISPMSFGIFLALSITLLLMASIPTAVLLRSHWAKKSILFHPSKF